MKRGSSFHPPLSRGSLQMPANLTNKQSRQFALNPTSAAETSGSPTRPLFHRGSTCVHAERMIGSHSPADLRVDLAVEQSHLFRWAFPNVMASGRFAKPAWVHPKRVYVQPLPARRPSRKLMFNGRNLDSRPRWYLFSAAARIRC